MLNVSWAKKRAEFVFVLATREKTRKRERERKGKRTESLHDWK